jgi:hypothetical protein
LATLAEQVVRTSAFTTCFNVFEAALAIVRERRLKPSEAHSVVLDAMSRVAIEITGQFLLRLDDARSLARASVDSTWATAYRIGRRRGVGPGFFMSARSSLAQTSTIAFELNFVGNAGFAMARPSC